MGSPSFPRSIFVESARIGACMEYAERNQIYGIAISPLNGFHLPDLSFLKDFPSIKSLTVLHSEMLDLSAVNELTCLSYLQLSGRPKQSVDIRNFPALEELRVKWWPRLQFGSAIPSLRVLSVSGYRPYHKDLTDLPDLPLLENLVLIRSPLFTLCGIDRLRGLTALEFSYLPKIVSISPLGVFRDSLLEKLEFSHCPRITDHHQVKVISSLRRLAFNYCGQIASLRFLVDLPVLDSFSFVGTNVVDGDLGSCLKIRKVGFFDKRHYSHRNADFEARIGLPMNTA